MPDASLTAEAVKDAVRQGEAHFEKYVGGFDRIECADVPAVVRACMDNLHNPSLQKASAELITKVLATATEALPTGDATALVAACMREVHNTVPPEASRVAVAQVLLALLPPPPVAPKMSGTLDVTVWEAVGTSSLPCHIKCSVLLRLAVHAEKNLIAVPASAGPWLSGVYSDVASRTDAVLANVTLGWIVFAHLCRLSRDLANELANLGATQDALTLLSEFLADEFTDDEVNAASARAKETGDDAIAAMLGVIACSLVVKPAGPMFHSIVAVVNDLDPAKENPAVVTQRAMLVGALCTIKSNAPSFITDAAGAISAAVSSGQLSPWQLEVCLEALKKVNQQGRRIASRDRSNTRRVHLLKSSADSWEFTMDESKAIHNSDLKAIVGAIRSFSLTGDAVEVSRWCRVLLEVARLTPEMDATQALSAASDVPNLLSVLSSASSQDLLVHSGAIFAVAKDALSHIDALQLSTAKKCVSYLSCLAGQIPSTVDARLEPHHEATVISMGDICAHIAQRCPEQASAVSGTVLRPLMACASSSARVAAVCRAAEAVLGVDGAATFPSILAMVGVTATFLTTHLMEATAAEGSSVVSLLRALVIYAINDPRIANMEDIDFDDVLNTVLHFIQLSWAASPETLGAALDVLAMLAHKLAHINARIDEVVRVGTRAMGDGKDEGSTLSLLATLHVHPATSTMLPDNASKTIVLERCAQFLARNTSTETTLKCVAALRRLSKHSKTSFAPHIESLLTTLRSWVPPTDENKAASCELTLLLAEVCNEPARASAKSVFFMHVDYIVQQPAVARAGIDALRTLCVGAEGGSECLLSEDVESLCNSVPSTPGADGIAESFGRLLGVIKVAQLAPSVKASVLRWIQTATAAVASSASSVTLYAAMARAIDNCCHDLPTDTATDLSQRLVAWLDALINTLRDDGSSAVVAADSICRALAVLTANEDVARRVFLSSYKLVSLTKDAMEKSYVAGGVHVLRNFTSFPDGAEAFVEAGAILVAAKTAQRHMGSADDVVTPLCDAVVAILKCDAKHSNAVSADMIDFALETFYVSSTVAAATATVGAASPAFQLAFMQRQGFATLQRVWGLNEKDASKVGPLAAIVASATSSVLAPALVGIPTLVARGFETFAEDATLVKTLSEATCTLAALMPDGAPEIGVEFLLTVATTCSADAMPFVLKAATASAHRSAAAPLTDKAASALDTVVATVTAPGAASQDAMAYVGWVCAAYCAHPHHLVAWAENTGVVQCLKVGAAAAPGLLSDMERDACSRSLARMAEERTDDRQQSLQEAKESRRVAEDKLRGTLAKCAQLEKDLAWLRDGSEQELLRLQKNIDGSQREWRQREAALKQEYADKSRLITVDVEKQVAVAEAKVRAEFVADRDKEAATLAKEREELKASYDARLEARKAAYEKQIAALMQHEDDASQQQLASPGSSPKKQLESEGVLVDTLKSEVEALRTKNISMQQELAHTKKALSEVTATSAALSLQLAAAHDDHTSEMQQLMKSHRQDVATIARDGETQIHRLGHEREQAIREAQRKVQFLEDALAKSSRAPADPRIVGSHEVEMSEALERNDIAREAAEEWIGFASESMSVSRRLDRSMWTAPTPKTPPPPGPVQETTPATATSATPRATPETTPRERKAAAKPATQSVNSNIAVVLVELMNLQAEELAMRSQLQWSAVDDLLEALPVHLTTVASGRSDARWNRHLTILKEQARRQQVEAKSIVEVHKKALAEEYEGVIETLKTDSAAAIKSRDTTIHDLRESVIALKEVIKQLEDRQLDHRDEVARAVRQTKQEQMAKESDLRSDISRLHLERDKVSFEAKVARNTNAVSEEAVNVTKARAHAMEADKNRMLLATTEAMESGTRQLLVSGEMDARALAHDLTTQLTILHEKEVRNLHAASARMLLNAAYLLSSKMPTEAAALLEAGDFNAVLRLEDTGNTDLGFCKAAAAAGNGNHKDAEAHLRSAVEGLVARHSNEKHAAKTDVERLQRDVLQLIKALESHEEKTKLLQERVATSSDSWEKRIDAASAQVELARKAAAGGAGALTEKASATAMDMLLDTHEKELRTLNEHLSAVEEENRNLKQGVAAEDAMSFQHLSERLSRDNASLSAQVNHLRTRLAAMEQEESTTRQSMDEVYASLRCRETAHEDEVRNRLREIEALKDALASLEQENSVLSADMQAAQSSFNSLERVCASLRAEVDETGEVNQKLREEIEAMAANALGHHHSGHTSPRGSGAPRSNSSSFLLSPTHRSQTDLTQSHLKVRQERDTLRRDLDAAIAEATSSEERRSKTMTRYMELLAAHDAAPRREQQLQSLSYDINKSQLALKDRESQLDTRLLEIERKEAAVNRLIARHQAHGLNIKASLAAGSHASSRRSSQTTTPTQAPLPLLADPVQSAPQGNRLAPLPHRQAVSLPPTSDPHPNAAKLPRGGGKK